MNLKHIFTIIVTISTISGLFLLMLNEEKMYLKNDFESDKIGTFDKTTKIEEAQKNLYTKFNELSRKEGKLSTVVGLAGLTVTGLVELGNIMIDSVMILPQIVENALELVLPPEVSSIVTVSLFSLIGILLIIELVKFITGKF